MGRQPINRMRFNPYVNRQIQNPFATLGNDLFSRPNFGNIQQPGGLSSIMDAYFKKDQPVLDPANELTNRRSDPLADIRSYSEDEDIRMKEKYGTGLAGAILKAHDRLKQKRHEEEEKNLGATSQDAVKVKASPDQQQITSPIVSRPMPRPSFPTPTLSEPSLKPLEGEMPDNLKKAYEEWKKHGTTDYRNIRKENTESALTKAAEKFKNENQELFKNVDLLGLKGGTDLPSIHTSSLLGLKGGTTKLDSNFMGKWGSIPIPPEYYG